MDFFSTYCAVYVYLCCFVADYQLLCFHNTFSQIFLCIKNVPLFINLFYIDSIVIRDLKKYKLICRKTYIFMILHLPCQKHSVSLGFKPYFMSMVRSTD